MTWEAFMRKRLADLHPKIFGPHEPDIVDALAYFEYHRRLNLLGFGCDYTNHPRNPRNTRPKPAYMEIGIC